MKLTKEQCDVLNEVTEKISKVVCEEVNALLEDTSIFLKAKIGPNILLPAISASIIVNLLYLFLDHNIPEQKKLDGVDEFMQALCGTVHDLWKKKKYKNNQTKENYCH